MRITTEYIIVSLLLVGLTGCGYSTRTLYPQDVSTVAVPLIKNRSFHRNIEFELTEAVKKTIEHRTPYKVISRSDADTVLEVVIVNVEQRQLSRNPTGSVPQELEVAVIVDYEWKSLRTGKTLVDRQGFEQVGRYIPSRSVGEPLDVAFREIVDQLAERIVSSMRADWTD